MNLKSQVSVIIAMMTIRSFPVIPVTERLKGLMREPLQVDPREFMLTYDDHVIVRNPFMQVQGAADLYARLQELCRCLTFARVEYLDQMIGTDSAYLKWQLHYRHPRLGQQTHNLRGFTHLEFGEKIRFQEDCFDTGQAVYEQVPMVSGMARWWRRRMAS